MDDNYIRINLEEVLYRLLNELTIYYKSANYDETIIKFDTDIVPRSWVGISFILSNCEFYKKEGEHYE